MICHTRTFVTEAEAEAFAAGVEFVNDSRVIVESIEPAEFEVNTPDYEKLSCRWSVIVSDYDENDDAGEAR
jgi:hypothetical protein